MLRPLLLVIPLVALLACSSGGGREIAITANEDACTPTSITAQPGEKLTFVIDNKAKGDREFEGTEGTKVEETIVPSGRTRKINYTTPNSESTQKLKCYIPGGPTTLIELKVIKSS